MAEFENLISRLLEHEVELVIIGGYEDVWDCSEEIELDGYICHILTIDALIKSKKAMGRDKDNEAIRHLEVIRENY